MYANFLGELTLGPPDAEEKSSGGGVPWWPFAVGGAVLIAGVALFIRRRRVPSQS